MELIFFEPVFKEMIWGGDNLKKVYDYQIPSENTGECWAISAHENGDCTILNGKYSGMKLSELYSSNRELFGNINYDKFPLLIKILDAKDDLSIQVHPNDEYANLNENGSFGKTECWYILDCKEDASIIIGHNAKTKAEMVDMINEGRWNDFIREIPIKKGDFFQIEPGTLHAIKNGTMILETQQSSDITYRVYDYDRLQNGVKRPLHIEKSIDVISVPFVEYENIPFDENDEIKKLCTSKFYDVYKIDIDGSKEIDIKAPFLNVSIIDGEGNIDGVSIKKGMHFIVPNGYGKFELVGNLSLIISLPK